MRRVLCVFPKYERSFGTLHHAYALTDGVRAFMPPQGLLTIAAYLPASWQVRFVDENMRPVSRQDLRWADVVFASGMHIQRPQLERIARLAHQHGKAVAVGGPSASASPEAYPDFDYVHVGELGDATDRLLAHIDEHGGARPGRQIRFDTAERLPLDQFPAPAYDLVRLDRYFLGSIQFSSGCPYSCEFCDIPALYGRKARLKTPEQITGELDAMLRVGNPGAVYFVDDNFIADPNAARALLPHLVAWQRERGFPVQFACEATLNLARHPDILELMREAYFCTVFCGIETPEKDALLAMKKRHNLSVPILDAVRTINDYGLEVVSGIIIGLDTDTPETADHIIEFMRLTNIPMLTINVLQALPKTPLWDRLASEGRLVSDEGRESNVVFKLPYEQVIEAWRRCTAAAYAPERLYERFAYTVDHAHARRIRPPASAARTSPRMLRKGFVTLAKVLLKVGLMSRYRRTFWRLAWPLIKSGRVESMLHVALVGHHLIEFARDALKGREAASFYTPEARALPPRKPADGRVVGRPSAGERTARPNDAPDRPARQPADAAART